MATKKWVQLQAALGVEFGNVSLLEQAFTHTSYVNENRQARHNERLEFLGDAVLELAVSLYLYETYPTRSEGELTKLRASIVCEPSLAGFAQSFGFGSMIRLGKGEELSGGRQRPAMLADVFEAYIGALYVDQGFDAVDGFLRAAVYPKVGSAETVLLGDFKSRLQEYVQQYDIGALSYRLASKDGPSHDRLFVSEVLLDERVLGSGSGKTKKESEQQAAAQALAVLQQ